MAIIDHKHPEANSTVVRNRKTGALVGFLKRINTDEGWIERYRVDHKMRLAQTKDGKPELIRERIGDKYEVISGVPPFIRVKQKDGTVKLFRRADVIPDEAVTPPKPVAAQPPAQIKVGGRVYVREDQARKGK